MFRTRFVSALTLALLLGGCNAGNVQPGAAEAAASSAQSASGGEERVAPAVTDVPGASSAAPVSPINNRLDQLNGRLTLLQEQVMQLKGLLEQQLEMGQMTLTRLQQMNQAGLTEASDAVGESEVGDVQDEQVDAAIDQLLAVVNQLGMGSLSDQYAVATTYTGKGAWILLRYRTDTGETWLAEGGSWLPLEEEASLTPSSYRVWLTRADQDLKGYVAVRLDQQSGQTWWLNDRRWQVYE